MTIDFPGKFYDLIETIAFKKRIYKKQVVMGMMKQAAIGQAAIRDAQASVDALIKEATRKITDEEIYDLLGGVEEEEITSEELARRVENYGRNY